jgi:hypothetical protein
MKQKSQSTHPKVGEMNDDTNSPRYVRHTERRGAEKAPDLNKSRDGEGISKSNGNLGVSTAQDKPLSICTKKVEDMVSCVGCFPYESISKFLQAQIRLFLCMQENYENPCINA